MFIYNQQESISDNCRLNLARVVKQLLYVKKATHKSQNRKCMELDKYEKEFNCNSNNRRNIIDEH